jgi:hypothetical protein
MFRHQTKGLCYAYQLCEIRGICVSFRNIVFQADYKRSGFLIAK